MCTITLKAFSVQRKYTIRKSNQNNNNTLPPPPERTSKQSQKPVSLKGMKDLTVTAVR